MAVRGARGLSGAVALCAFTLLSFASTAAAAGPNSAAAMYSPDQVFAIDLTLPPASMEALENEPESDEYVEAAFSIAATDGTPDGTGEFTAPQKVEVRLKGGHGSFREIDRKAAFKLKFPKAGLFLGLRRMTLNNMVQDPSMVHETLAYDTFRALGVPASRTGYVFLRINGVPYGVYLNLETLDNISLPQWFAATQHLYEADAPGTDVVSEDLAGFEVDEGDDADIADLEALIAAANDGIGDWSDGMDPVANLEEMTRMWAVERYAGHWDGYAGSAGAFRPNNYYLHSDPAGIFQMMPWGTDQTWDVPTEFDEPAGGLLFNECLADASCEALYEGALGEVAATVPELELDTTAICTAELLAPWQALEDPARREYDQTEIATGVADARAFIASRPAELAAWLGTGAPAVPDGDDPCPAPEPPSAPSRPTAPQPSAAPAPSVSSLQFVRIRIGRGAVVVHVRTPAAGGLTLRGLLLARKGLHPICHADAIASGPGTVRLVCRLPRDVREARRLRLQGLRLSVSLARSDGTSLRSSTRVRLSRTGPSGSRHRSS